MRRMFLLWMAITLTLPGEVWAQGTIKHLIFIVKENRSFDTLFNCFPGTGSCLANFSCFGIGCNSTCVGGLNNGQSCTTQAFCGNSGHCTGSIPVAAGNPTLGDLDCPHLHLDFIEDFDSGAMDGFQHESCNLSGTGSWNNTYNGTTIPQYWQLASSYGLAAIFASAMAPSFPSHMIMFAGTSSETMDNPNGLASGGAPPNGQKGTNWNLDTYHYGTCGTGSTSNGNALCGLGSSADSGTLNVTSANTITWVSGPQFSTNWINVPIYIGNTNTNAATIASCSSTTTCTLTGSASNVGSQTFMIPDLDCASSAGALTPGACWFNRSSGICCQQGKPCNFATAGTSCAKNTDCKHNQFCADGNVYGQAGGASLYPAIDLNGSAGAPGTNTGNDMWPGVCQAHRTISCAKVCGTACSSPSDANDDPACTALSDTCDVQQATGAASILQGSRASVGVNVTTVADMLDTAGVNWSFYVHSDEALRNPVTYYPHLWYGADRSKVFSDTQFVTDAGNCTSDSSCTLASVVWLEASNSSGGLYNDGTNEHPPNTMASGQAWSWTQVQAVMSNPYLWNNTQVFIVWDDFGGFYDHVAPTVDAQNWRNGFRVPAICVGKYCKTGFINTTFVFESMLKCVENLFLGGKRLPGGLFDGSSEDLCLGCVAGGHCTGHDGKGMVDLTLSDPPLPAQPSQPVR